MKVESQINVELKSIFNIKIGTQNIFSHIEMWYKYPTYSVSPVKVNKIQKQTESTAMALKCPNHYTRIKINE